MSLDQYQEALSEMERRYNELQNEKDNTLAKLQTVTDTNQTLTEENEFFLRKVTGFQTEMNNMRNDQARLESQLYSQERAMDDLKKENQAAIKVRRDLDKKLANELLLFERERLAWQEKENELSREIRSLKNSINGELNPDSSPSPLKRRVSVTVNGRSNSVNGRSSVETPDETLSEKAPDSPSSLLGGQDAKSAARIKAQDRTIMELKGEVDAQKQLAADHVAESQRQVSKIAQLENELGQVQQMNRSLMEDNESYQILLHEKTMSGEFMTNPLMQQNRFTSSSSPGAGEEDVAALKKAAVANGGELNLAAELDRVEADTQQSDIEKLQEEIKNQKDENKALTFYISKILLRVIASDLDILSIDPPKPAPPKPAPPAVSPTDSKSNARRRRTTISSPMSFWARKNSAEDDAAAADVKLKPSASTSGHSRTTSDATKAATTTTSTATTTTATTEATPSNASTENLDGVVDADGKTVRRHSSAVGPLQDLRNSGANRNSTGGFFKRLSVASWATRTNVLPAAEETAGATDESNGTAVAAAAVVVETDKLSPNGSTGELRKSGEVQVLGSLGEVAEEDA